MNYDKISVIMPVHNSSGTLKRSVNSILDQTYKNFELLLIENGSTDNSNEIIAEFSDERIKVFHLDVGNVSNARNKGISESSGEFIYFIDADDTLEKNALEILLNTIRLKSAEAVIFNYNKVSNKKEKSVLPWVNEIITNDTIREKLIPNIISIEKDEKSLMGSVWRIFTYKDKIDNIQFEENLRIAEDVVFLIYLFSKLNSLYVLENALYNYYFNENSALNSANLNSINYSILYHNALYHALEECNLQSDDIIYRFYKNQGRMYTNAVSFISRMDDKNAALVALNDVCQKFRMDRYNYWKIDYPVLIKVTFILLKLKSVKWLYFLYRTKEKHRMRKLKK